MNIQIIKSYRNTNPEPMRVINRWPEIKKQLEAKKIPILEKPRDGFWKRYRAIEPGRKVSEYKRIERHAMALFDITHAELTSARRTKQNMPARWFVMYWATRKLQMTSTKLGHLLGRDHSTVLNGVVRWPEVRQERGRTLRAIR